MTDETGWLIEFKPSVSRTPCYYGQTDDDGLGMTANHDAAVRFARKVDAEAVIADIGWTEAFASEHMWCAAPVFQCPDCEADIAAGKHAPNCPRTVHS